MLQEKEILKRYEAQGFKSGNSLYLSTAYAIQFVQDCQNNNLSIIGIEGFHRQENLLQPLLDKIADFSRVSADNWIEFQSRCNQLSLNFLQNSNVQGDILWDFTIIDTTEWKDYY